MLAAWSRPFLLKRIFHCICSIALRVICELRYTKKKEELAEWPNNWANFCTSCTLSGFCWLGFLFFYHTRETCQSSLSVVISHMSLFEQCWNVPLNEFEAWIMSALLTCQEENANYKSYALMSSDGPLHALLYCGWSVIAILFNSWLWLVRRHNSSSVSRADCKVYINAFLLYVTVSLVTTCTGTCISDAPR